MTRLRILHGVYIPSLDKVVNYNDEIEVSDEKLVRHLVKEGCADVLIEQKVVEKTAKKSQKQGKKEVKEDA
ncbi:hypothetical protein [Bacillus wiedmannii]|uniref:hypothetical protein n=1 Tax=Bacillus wiedmannii TaxID=1890302 RepID=UPI000BFE772E|nr:hypothetical protein [Bacillus wiedmannii]PHA62866.1 hypothetical protein COE75_16640 [Bacillus wiedmannii]